MSNLNTNVDSIIDYYNSIAGKYDSMYTDDVSKMEDRFLEFFLRKLLAHDNRFHNVLDLGCGTGWVLDHFSVLPDGNYKGFDPSGQMIKIARKKHPEYEFGVKGVLQIEESTYRWADTVLLLYGVGSHIPLDDFLEKLFSVDKEQDVVLMFISGIRPCRAGLEINYWTPGTILQRVLKHSGSIREFSFRGLTNSEFTHWDTSIADAYSWILKIDKCRESV